MSATPNEDNKKRPRVALEPQSNKKPKPSDETPTARKPQEPSANELQDLRFKTLEQDVLDLKKQNQEFQDRVSTLERELQSKVNTLEQKIAKLSTENVVVPSSNLAQEIKRPSNLETKPAQEIDDFVMNYSSETSESEDDDEFEDPMVTALDRMKKIYMSDDKKLFPSTALYWLVEVFTPIANRVQVPTKWRVPGPLDNRATRYGYWEVFNIVGLEQMERSLRTGHNHDWLPKDNQPIPEYIEHLKSTLHKMGIKWDPSDPSIMESPPGPVKKAPRKRAPSGATPPIPKNKKKNN